MVEQVFHTKREGDELRNWSNRSRLLILCCSQMQEKAEWFWFSHTKLFPNSWGVGMSVFCLFSIGFSRGLSAPGEGQLQKTTQFPQGFRQIHHDPRVSPSGHSHCIKRWNGQAVLSTTSVGTLPSGASLPLSHFSVVGQRTVSSWGNFFQRSPPGLFLSQHGREKGGNCCWHCKGEWLTVALSFSQKEPNST